MDERNAKVSELLQEAAETHHRVFRITDGLLGGGLIRAGG